jgi:MFS family permease
VTDEDDAARPPLPRRVGALAIQTLIGIAAAAALLAALWMLLLGLAMAYGNPLGAPDSGWRVAAGLGAGACGVLLGAAIAAWATGRRGASAALAAAAAAGYSALSTGYPGYEDGLDALAVAALAAPWCVSTLAVAGWLLHRRRPAPLPAHDDAAAGPVKETEPTAAAG